MPARAGVTRQARQVPSCVRSFFGGFFPFHSLFLFLFLFFYFYIAIACFSLAPSRIPRGRVILTVGYLTSVCLLLLHRFPTSRGRVV